MRQSISIVFFLILLSAGCLRSAPGYHLQQKDKTAVNTAQASSDEIKTLAKGRITAFEEPFVAVFRDGETYGKLRDFEPNAPALDADYFDSHIVIAAFLGTRNTGGFGIGIGPDPAATNGGSGRQLLLEEKTPPKDAMLAQVITAPYKIVSLAGPAPVSLRFGSPWNQLVRPYHVSVTCAEVGGLADKSEEFQVDG